MTETTHTILRQQILTCCGNRRPAYEDMPVRTHACRGLVEPIRDWLLQEPSLASDATTNRLLDLLTRATNTDAYRFAHNLERFGWPADAALLEVLADYPIYLENAFAEAERIWVAETNVTVSEKPGAQVTVDLGTGLHLDGKIVETDPERARVRVRPTTSQADIVDTISIPAENIVRNLQTVS